MNKKILAFVLSGILILGSINASAAIINERVTETPITKGVTQYVIDRFTDKGWYKIFTLKVDLNENFISLGALTSSKGVNTRDTVPQLAKENNSLAGVNADFFQPSGSFATRASALGVVIKDGRMLTTPARGKAMATAAVDNDNIMSMGLWDQYINLIAPDGAVQQIFHINKYYDEGALILFNKDWDEYSPGAPISNMEMVVVDDIVTEIRWRQEGIKIPDNGYIISSTSNTDTFLTDHFKVGDSVKIETWVEPNPANYKTAIGGGTLLLKDGAKAPVTHNISGIHPRTAMGADKTGKIVYIVAVDGRQQYSVGMTLDEIRNYMSELGCHNAINFDGGGSTTYVSKEPWEDEISVKNSPSEGALRRVANGIGVISTAPVGQPAILEIKSNEKDLYAQSSYSFTTRVFDEYYHNLPVDQNEITYSVSGTDGYFSGNTFYPQSSGMAVITARYKNLEAQYEKYIRSAKQEPDTDIMRLPSNSVVNGTKIAVIGNTDYTNLLGMLYSYRAIENANKEADAVCLLDKVKDNIANKVSVPLVYGEYYYAAYKKDNIIIQLNNRNGGLYKSDPEQWNKFSAQLEDINAKNVIITLSQPPTAEGFSDSLELDLFKQTLEEKLVDKGKNVFVVYDDNSNSIKIENGIRYFGFKGIKNVSTADYNSLKECSYLVITSDGDNVKYQIKSILDL